MSGAGKTAKLAKRPDKTPAGEPAARDKRQSEGKQQRNLDRIHHIAIAVENVAETVTWYANTFACEVEYQDASWAFLRFENIRLALVVPHQHPPHIAFLSEHAEKFGKLKAHRDGSRSVYIKDAAGNAVEIVDKDSLGALI
ncbi:MAG TPA: VOC family protein [Candidatus Obscuribacterales bacterium]